MKLIHESHDLQTGASVEIWLYRIFLQVDGFQVTPVGQPPCGNLKVLDEGGEMSLVVEFHQSREPKGAPSMPPPSKK